MADICKCIGKDCTRKSTCYRYLAESSCRQSWFANTPLDEHGKCVYYWEHIPITEEDVHEIQSRW